MTFEWHEDKALLNLEKHGVEFEEARSVFFDDEAILYDDPDHSVDEDRFLLVGPSAKLRVLVVAHCLRCKGDVVRIISARRATPRERKQYAKDRSRL